MLMKCNAQARIVGPDVPPTDEAERWERSLSPWHADAFPAEFKDRAPEQGDRKSGWLELDWCGNAIGWVPDGTEILANNPLTHLDARPDHVRRAEDAAWREHEKQERARI